MPKFARSAEEAPARSAEEAMVGRIREIRIEVFGPDGLDELARRSGIPARTWMNYESGMTIPGLTLLLFIELTSAQPLWLQRGQGPKYRDAQRVPGIYKPSSGSLDASRNRADADESIGD